MCCPYSTPVFKGKVQIYFPKLKKLMPLKDKFTAGPIKCQKMIFLFFSYLNKFLSEDSEVEDTAEIKELVLKHLKLLFQLLDICNDMNLEEIFEKNGKKYFLIFLCKERRAIAKEALKLLCQFPNTYLCKTAF